MPRRAVDDDSAEDRPSKSALKRRAKRLHDLGVVLAGRKNTVLDALPLGEATRDAIASFQKTTSNSARKRARQRVAKLMREEDEDALLLALARLDEPDPREQRRFRQAQQWRARIHRNIGEIDAFLDAFPDADGPQLRQAAQAEDADNRLFAILYGAIAARA